MDRKTIIEIIRKSDPAVTHRCKQLIDEIDKIESQINQIKRDVVVKIQELKKDVEVFEKDLNELISKSYQTGE